MRVRRPILTSEDSSVTIHERARQQALSGILTQLQVAIREAELERIRRRPTDELTAYDLYLKGRSLFLSGTRQGNEEARRLFERAIELDSQFAEAYGGLSLTYTVNCYQGWDEAHELSQRAFALDGPASRHHERVQPLE